MASPTHTHTLDLHYFDFPGRAACIRLALKLAGLEFTDTRVARDDFVARKTSGFYRFGQMPVLFVGDEKTQLNQTSSILRYVAKQAPASGLYPTDDLSAAMVDSCLSQSMDMLFGVSASMYPTRFGVAAYSDDEEAAHSRKQTRLRLSAEILPTHLAFFEKIASENADGPWLVGSTPTIADCFLYTQLKWLSSGMVDDIDTSIITSQVALSEMMAAFAALPAVAAHYA